MIFLGDIACPDEKIDDFIRKEEFRARVDAYLKVLKKYMEEHPDEIVDQYKFFYDYVEEHPLHEERPVKNRDVGPGRIFLLSAILHWLTKGA